jgi:hypothetical protein
VSIVQVTYPFDVQAGAAGTFRRWAGSITWTRDLTTQIVTMSYEGDLVAGVTTSGLYVYWDPALPVELRAERDEYPYIDGISSQLAPNGLGYIYIGANLPGVNTFSGELRYLTGAPTQEDEPDTGSFLGDVNALAEQVGVAVYPGFAPTGAKLPYIVSRPLDVGRDDEDAINGDAIDWTVQISLYCAAASVEASFNLALALIGTLQGARMRGTTLAASMGYNGAPVEGHYESQVTAFLNQGALV